MKNGYIGNITIILFALIIFFGIGYIIYRDMRSIEKHLEECKKQCYPAIVVQQFSRKKCFCQPAEEVLNEQ